MNEREGESERGKGRGEGGGKGGKGGQTSRYSPLMPNYSNRPLLKVHAPIKYICIRHKNVYQSPRKVRPPPKLYHQNPSVIQFTT